MPERVSVTAWLDGDEPLLAVVGVAGSGKSAMLGMVLASTLPDLVTELRQRTPAAWPPEVVPRDAHFQAVCQLSGKSVADVVASLVVAFHLQPATDIDDVVGQLRAAGTAPTLLADALRRRGVQVRTGTTARALRSHGDRAWVLTTGPTTDAVDEVFDAVVLATPAAPTARLLADVSPAAAAARPSQSSQPPGDDAGASTLKVTMVDKARARRGHLTSPLKPHPRAGSARQGG